MRSKERKRLEQLYMTQVEAALSKRLLAYNLLEEAANELAKARTKLKALYKEDKDGKQEAEKE